jgi:hypothetical protein
MKHQNGMFLWDHYMLGNMNAIMSFTMRNQNKESANRDVVARERDAISPRVLGTAVA